LRDGTRAIIRPITPEDRKSFVVGFEELSGESRFRRFFFDKKTLTENELDKLASPDGIDHIAYGIAALEDDGMETPIGVGHCFRDKADPGLAEIAMVTSDLWQSDGAGSELIKSLAAASLAAGIRKWLAVTLVDNTAMLRLIRKVGTKLEENQLSGGILEVIYELNVPVPP
jgi:acetyltransferase